MESSNLDYELFSHSTVKKFIALLWHRQNKLYKLLPFLIKTSPICYNWSDAKLKKTDSLLKCFTATLKGGPKKILVWFLAVNDCLISKLNEVMSRPSVREEKGGSKTSLETLRKLKNLIICKGITLLLSKKSNAFEPMSKMINSKFVGLFIIYNIS